MEPAHGDTAIDSRFPRAARVLVVDDETWIRVYFAELLSEWGYISCVAGEARTAEGMIAETDFDIVIADLFIGPDAGFTVLTAAQRARSAPEVIVITGRGVAEHAVQALNLGAFDYLKKPVDAERLRLTLTRALEFRRLKAEVGRLSGTDSNVFTANVATSSLALHDSVTGLPNRVLFFDRLHQALLSRAAADRTISLVVLSVDGLRRAGIAYGPAHSDVVLVQIARGLVHAVFRRDTVSRTGDIEFAVIADVKTPESTTRLLEKIVAFENALRAKDRRFEGISFSMGVSFFPTDGATPGGLYQRALMALDTQQRRGSAGYQFYQADRDRRIQRAVELERKLGRGLADGRFSIVLQPYHRVADDSVHGAEALLRWSDDDETAVSPARFIPVLESSRVIVSVTEWIVRELGGLQKRFLDEGVTDQYFSLNVSPVHLARYDDARRLVALIGEAFHDPSRVIVEVTEGIFLEDSGDTDRAMTLFADAGIPLAIDDFGTGFSSLSYLTRYGFKYIKIDRTFVGSADVRPDSATIVAATISMAQQLGITTVAEGVENDAQLNLVRRFGCDIVQGFLFSRPLCPSRLLEYAIRSRAQTCVPVEPIVDPGDRKTMKDER